MMSMTITITTSITMMDAQLAVGSVCVDYLASVSKFPSPDDKIRSVGFQVQGGGNAANAITAVSRLGIRGRLLSKIVNDGIGQDIIDELEADGVDTSCIIRWGYA